jgi:hypothetical protein
MFSQPVDPNRDDCEDYFDIIKQPMDLGTIRTKLASHQYKSVAEWKSDVNLVWSNSATYNSKSFLLRIITKDMNELFHKLTATFSDSPQNDWNDQLQLLGKEMEQIMKEIMAPPVVPKSEPLQQPKAGNSGGGRPQKMSDSGKTFGRDEMVRLSHEINSIEDVEILCELTELVREQESDFEDNGEDIDVDLNSLSLQTLILLRKKVDELLKK